MRELRQGADRSGRQVKGGARGESSGTASAFLSSWITFSFAATLIWSLSLGKPIRTHQSPHFLGMVSPDTGSTGRDILRASGPLRVEALPHSQPEACTPFLPSVCPGHCSAGTSCFGDVNQEKLFFLGDWALRESRSPSLSFSESLARRSLLWRLGISPFLSSSTLVAWDSLLGSQQTL